MFSGLTPAADSTVGGIVTLLAAAQAIGRVKERISATDKPIMFTFFNGVSRLMVVGHGLKKFRAYSQGASGFIWLLDLDHNEKRVWCVRLQDKLYH